MELALKLGLGSRNGKLTGPSPGAAITALGARDGFAINFLTDRMVINDSATPANNFDGVPFARLNIYGSDPVEIDPIKGLNLSAARDFGVALATALFPHNPNAIHVYARFQLNSADAGDQRYVYMVKNTGSDRFAIYTTVGAGFRWVTADGVSADTEVSSLALVADTQYQTRLGADIYGRTWVDDDGVQTNDQLHQIAVADPLYVGIGGYPDQAYRQLDGYLAEIAVISEPIALEKRLSLGGYPTLLGAEGDSHTFNVSFGMTASEFYPAVIGQVRNWAVRNDGGSGESSAQMLGQVDQFLAQGAPDIALIYAGSNDVDTVVSASPAPTTTEVSVLDAAKLAVGGWVAINGESRKIQAVSGTDLTLENALSAPPVSGDTVAIDTVANIRGWVQAMKSAGVANIAVVGSHYLNFPSGGDSTVGEQALRAVTRAAQLEAALAETVTYVDTYAFMRQQILDGAVTQGDWAVWHQGASDTHLTTAGEAVLAAAIMSAI